MNSPDPPSPDPERMLDYVERFALVLHANGVPRMPARVFAYVLAEDAEEYTAADLAEGLQVSPAAISGAVRYLTTVGMLSKSRKPGSRADHYRIFDNEIWSMIISQREPMLRAYMTSAAEGVKLLGPETRGGRRMWETYEFFAFVITETDGMMQRWREHWAKARAEQDPSNLAAAGRDSAAATRAG
ncbi:MAG: GbsR/MarR family transcriptional regulator [Stackebrandtia sp.]